MSKLLSDGELQAEVATFFRIVREQKNDTEMLPAIKDLTALIQSQKLAHADMVMKKYKEKYEPTKKLS